MTKVTSDELLRLLSQPVRVSQLAKHFKVSHSAIIKRLRVLEGERKVYRTCKWPAVYVVWDGKQEKLQLNKSVIRELGFVTSKDSRRLVEPHHDGYRFKILEGELAGGEVKRFGRNGGAVKRQWFFGDKTVIAFSSGKVLVWVKKWKGITPNQQVVNSRTDVRLFMQEWAYREGVKVEYVEPLGVREWNTTVKPFSKEFAEVAGFKEKPVQVGNIVAKFDDKTHKGLAEFNSADGSSIDVRMQVLHKLFFDGIPDRLVEAEGKLEKQKVALEKMAEAVKALSEVVAPSDVIKPVRPEERRESQ